jgi:segregation and condensation protein A
LPTLELSGEEERDIKELQYRLAVYQILKDAGRGLRTALLSPMLWEGLAQDPEPLFIPEDRATQETLLRAAHTLIEGFPKMTVLPKVEVKKIVSLEEMIERMSGRINSAMRMSFREFVGRKERGEIIVGFLALLELVKQGILKAHQEQEFGDIQLQSDSVSTPSYE